MPGELAVAWLIVGLGNPGSEYAASRHNVGFRVAAVLAAAAGASFRGPERGALWAWARLGGPPAVLLQPQEYMNSCGPSAAAWLGVLRLTPDRLLVISDDLDLEVGRVKVGRGGGDGGHRGIRSLAEALGDLTFPRVRVGIGRLVGDDAAAYVLAPPGPGEAEVLRAAEVRAAEAARAVLAEGLAAAMNRFNPWPPPEGNHRPQTIDPKPEG